MQLLVFVFAASAALASTSAFAACERATPQGRCVNQWGNLIPTDEERRFDAYGNIRVNLANEAVYYANGQWYVRRDYSNAAKRKGDIPDLGYGYSEGPSIDYSRRSHARW